tara:strand:+ start:295 stop:462 length:168 start_codon:yes stop_codon:yes gene_type:complete
LYDTDGYGHGFKIEIWLNLSGIALFKKEITRVHKISKPQVYVQAMKVTNGSLRAF